jgi:hypothetical protein
MDLYLSSSPQELESNRENQGVCILFGVFGEGTCWAGHVEDMAKERGRCIIDACVWAFND